MERTSFLQKTIGNYFMVLLITMFYLLNLFNMCTFVFGYFCSSKLNLKCNHNLTIIHLWYKCSEHCSSWNKCSDVEDFKGCESLASVR